MSSFLGFTIKICLLVASCSGSSYPNFEACRQNGNFIEGSGLLSTVGNFGGAPSWKLGLFDVAKATRWEDVVEALVSNEPRRGTDSVTLIFERPLKD